jgi:integrase
MLAENVQARTVMEIFGHSDISVTMNTYSHVSSKMMRDAADKMDGVFGEKHEAQSLVAVSLAVN